MYHDIPADDPIDYAIGFEMDFALDRDPQSIQFLGLVPAFGKIDEAGAGLFKTVQDRIGVLDEQNPIDHGSRSAFYAFADIGECLAHGA